MVVRREVYVSTATAVETATTMIRMARTTAMILWRRIFETRAVFHKTTSSPDEIPFVGVV